jgi:vancomycin resistance protein VanJ
MNAARLSLRRILSNLFVALVGAYGLSVTGFLLLRSIVGDEWLPLSLFNSFAHLLFLPALLMIPLCLLFRRVRVIILLLPPLVAFLLSYAPFFMPRTSVALADAPRLSLMTYNIKAQVDNLDAFLNVVRNSGADIVFLQELSVSASERIEAEFQEIYPHQALHPQPDPSWSGMGVLSRFAIETDDYWKVYFGHQRVSINVNGQPVTLYNTHPVPPFSPSNVLLRGYEQREQELVDIISRISDESEEVPLILAGDMNMTDQSSDYRRVSVLLTDAYREVGWGMGFTFPNFSELNPSLAFLPALARIDYVFHNSHFQAAEARVMPDSGGSDHYPVYAVFTIQ